MDISWLVGEGGSIPAAGCKLMSHIIFFNTPPPPSVRRELVYKVDSNHPSVTHLFEQCNDILKTLITTSSTKKDFPEKKETTNANSSKVKTENRSFKRQEKKTETARKFHINKPASTLENFSTSSSPEKEETTKPRYCKFCESQGHSMFGCTTYETHKSQVKRCDGLKICHLCSINKHFAPQCPGHFKKMLFPCSFL